MPGGSLGGVSFIQGHARETGWVMAHRRRPNHAEEGQLSLLAGAEEAGQVSPVAGDLGEEPGDHPQLIGIAAL